MRPISVPQRIKKPCMLQALKASFSRTYNGSTLGTLVMHEHL